MRLWHYKLIQVLPKKQLLGQWRELWCIISNIEKYGTPNHILVDNIMEYSCYNFITYSKMVYDELVRRGYNPKRSWVELQDKVLKCDNFPTETENENNVGNLFKHWHTERYLEQCFFNLQEKYDCGGMSFEEWSNVVVYLNRTSCMGEKYTL